MDEASKAVARRVNDARFARKFLVGCGIDIGAGKDSVGAHKNLFPLMGHVHAWDWDDGDAQYLSLVDPETFNFVHSSHCLEHMVDPKVALSNWFKVLKPGGHLIITVPDEDLYEQGVWPSTFNEDHKHTFTIHKISSWSPVSINLVDLIPGTLGEEAEIIKIELLNHDFKYGEARWDQTGGLAECAIEFIVRKRRG